MPVNPTARDFFQMIVEERKRAEATEGKSSPRAKGLKVLANATSYGIYAQMTRNQLPDRQRETVRDYGSHDQPHTCKVTAPEDPAAYSFPPIAATITGAARLMLALLERRVTDAGGSYAFCDTDSMAIIATTDGGLIPCPGGPHVTTDGQAAVQALSDQQVESIRQEFNQLNPYENVPGTDSILELEEENYVDPETRTERRQLHCYAISAQRYVLYNQNDAGQPQVRAYTHLEDGNENPDDVESAIRKTSEHGLGHLLNPIYPESDNRAWISQTWKHILQQHLNLPTTEPDWLEQPAVARTTVSSPIIRRQFTRLNQDQGEQTPYADQIKPFNFLNSTSPSSTNKNDPTTSRTWCSSAPTNPTEANGSSPPGSTATPDADTTSPQNRPTASNATALSIQSPTATSSPNTSPTAKTRASAPPSNRASPRPPDSSNAARSEPVPSPHIGKEANQLEGSQTQLIADQDEVLNQYDDPEQHYYQHVALPILRELGPREAARRTGHSLGVAHAALAGKSTPRSKC